MKCPGQDTAFWTLDAVFEARCPRCGRVVELFKDDVTRICPHCRNEFANPKIDLGCAAHCRFAEQCLGAVQCGSSEENEKTGRTAFQGS